MVTDQGESPDKQIRMHFLSGKMCLPTMKSWNSHTIDTQPGTNTQDQGSEKIPSHYPLRNLFGSAYLIYQRVM